METPRGFFFVLIRTTVTAAMRQRLADFDVEIVSAERPKFAAPILFLHGLWVGPWIWRSFAGYLAHRGWSSYGVAWRETAQSIGGLTAAVQRAMRELDTPAILVGHDLGATVALQIREACAIVALAPLPVGDAAKRLPLFTGPRAQWARWRRGVVRPTRKQAEQILGLGKSDALEAEPSTWLDDLVSQSPLVPPPAAPPSLIVAGGADQCVAPTEAQILAKAVNAELLTYPDASHALPVATDWERRVSDVHRWLVRKLGASLLLLRGDEDLQEE